MTPLDHEQAQELLDALHDGELDAETAAAVNAHVASCERCKKLDQLLGGTLKQALAQAPESQHAPDLLAGVQRRIRLRSRGRYYSNQQLQPTRPHWPMILSSGLTLLLLAIAYYYLTQILVVKPEPQKPLLPDSTKTQ